MYINIIIKPRSEKSCKFFFAGNIYNNENSNNGTIPIKRKNILLKAGLQLVYRQRCNFSRSHTGTVREYILKTHVWTLTRIVISRI